MSDMQSSISVLEDWREKTVDPALKSQAKSIAELQEYRDEQKGRFAVIIWLNGGILVLVSGLIVALFTWGLSHITLKVEAKPDTIGAYPHSSDAGLPPTYAGR